MKRVKRWRYYCEFCKKSGSSAGHMAKHEQRCTMNPNRKCGHCRAANLNQRPVSEHLALVAGMTSAEEILESLRDSTEGCPSCILAAIRQGELGQIGMDEDGPWGEAIQFDYKAELKLFWGEVKGEENKREMYCSQY